VLRTSGEKKSSDLIPFPTLLTWARSDAPGIVIGVAGLRSGADLFLMSKSGIFIVHRKQQRVHDDNLEIRFIESADFDFFGLRGGFREPRLLALRIRLTELGD